MYIYTLYSYNTFFSYVKLKYVFKACIFTFSSYVQVQIKGPVMLMLLQQIQVHQVEMFIFQPESCLLLLTLCE